MPVIAIYNNKGGEGKSTVTVGLAEFLAGNRRKKVLVIDLDAQASSSCALLGHQLLNSAIDEGRNSANLMAMLRGRRRPINDLKKKYVVERAGTEARGSALAELGVLIPDGPRMFDIQEQMNWRHDQRVMIKKLKPALQEYDYVLIDMPANIDKGSLFCINGLVMSDFILIPTRSTSISLSAMPPTFELIRYVQDINGNGRPAVLGFLLNATDRRHQQYKANFPAIIESSEAGDLPPLFKNFWPSSPAFESATDAKRQFQTLKERFGKSYDQARMVAKELETRCQQFDSRKPAKSVKRTIWQKLGLA